MLKQSDDFSNQLKLAAGALVFRDTHLQVHRVGDTHRVPDHRAADAGYIKGCISSPIYGELLDKVSLTKDLTVVDIGASVGDFPLLQHARGHGFNALTCVELNPATHIQLHCDILNNWPKSTVLNRGVTSQTGEISLRLGHGDTADSRKGSPKGAGEEVTVQTMRLDDISDAPQIDLLKMDIEGAETDVLLEPGHEKTQARTSVLVIEIHPLEQAQAIHDAITATGLQHVWGSEPLIGQHVLAREKHKA